MAKQRAVAYCRVSSKSKAQMHSLGYQTDYWQRAMAESSEYEFVGIYADSGISGRSMRKRPQLLRLLEDAKEKRFDVVFTKSVARFARNTEELLSMVRELRDEGIKVIFEKEKIDTFNPNSEVFLTIAASVAENDLKIYSQNQTWAMREKYKNGYISVGAKILGYRMRKEDNTLIVEPSEAEVVKRIFYMYIHGKGILAIAKQLTAEKVGLNYGNKGKWSRGAIHYILNNEKYIGCALMQKYYNEDGICRKNRGEVKQYYMENTHEAIISVEDFQKVQELMRERACECEIGVARKNYEFTGKIRCGCCGGNYIRKVQNCGKPYEAIVWVCSRKDTFGSENCYGTRIKDTVLKEKFVECYNEFTAIKGEGDSLLALNQQLAWLLEQERELNALKVNRMIEIADYNAEWKAVKAQIDDINKQIEKQSIQKLTKTDLVPITEYDESKVETFLDYAVMTPKKITFIFINGVEISREYTNGASGNAKGWYDRRMARLAREKEVAYGN